MAKDLSKLDLPGLIANKFVARTDVKAVQTSDGKYHPERSKWKMQDFRDHIAGDKTFGHYVSDAEGNVKVIVFDIDLEKTGTWVEQPDMTQCPQGTVLTEAAWYEEHVKIHQSNPREDWLDRKHPGRQWYKSQLRTMAEMLSSAMKHTLDIQVACAYSGNKGVHAYGFLPELMPAAEARAGALLALEYAGTSFGRDHKFELYRGVNFYKHSVRDPETGFDNLSIELFPKQSSMDGKDLGNLVRLPMGRNQKNPKDPCFFLDQTTAHNELTPHPDPVALLQGKSPWEI